MWSAVLAGAVTFPALYCCAWAALRPAVTGWSEADTACVSERLVSAFHASLATAAGLCVVTSCNDVMTDSHWLANGFVLFGAPYLTFDLYAMYLSHFYKEAGSGQGHSLQTVKAFLLRDWLLVLHHTVLLLLFLPVALFFRRGLGDFFIGCLFLTECSTPFVSIGKILIQLGLDGTRLHRINGIMVLLTFLTCRILLFPFMYWSYGVQLGIPLHTVPFHLPLHCNMGNLLILAPQLYWFVLLLRKAKRLYLRGSGRTTDGDKPRTE